jgi:hypothetical protein
MALHFLLYGGTKNNYGDVAQLGERSVRNAEARGSNPLISTNSFLTWPLLPSEIFQDFKTSPPDLGGFLKTPDLLLVLPLFL